MAHNRKSISRPLAIVPLIIILILFIGLLAVIFEGEKPSVTLQPMPEYLSADQKFTIKISDRKRGLKRLRITYRQGGKEIILLKKQFPFEGFLNNQGVHEFNEEFNIDPSSLHLAQGRLDVNIQVWDYSKRGGGDGNMTLLHHKMIVDTMPPSIRSISRMHNINRGGAGLVVYRTSSDTIESGVYVNDYFFPGFPVDEEKNKGVYLSYIAVSHDSSLDPTIYLWSKDKAENTSKATFYFHVRRKRFGNERMNITDRYLKRVLSYFSFYKTDTDETDLNRFLRINNEMRKEDHERFLILIRETSPTKFWEGRFLRLNNAATMARFGNRRSYYYRGEKVDEQIHLGIDLASLPNSPVLAANNGRVLFAERNGIYGLMVVLDHGQGLASMYGHLDSILVTTGQVVKKEDIIGLPDEPVLRAVIISISVLWSMVSLLTLSNGGIVTGSRII